MIPFEVASIFFFASVVIIMAPGPDNIFVLTQSALYGRRAGLIATLGICTGLVVHTAAVAFGVAAIFQTSTLAFNILKIFGVLYLLYLAWQLFRTGEIRQSQNSQAGIIGIKLYTRGTIMNVANPKVAIFFLAFLPQFVDPARGSLIIQTLTLGTLFILVTFVAKRVDDRSAAEEILQDVFVKIHSRMGSLQEAVKLESCLYQITRNAVIDFYRTRKPSLDLPEWVSQPEADPSTQAR